MIKEKSKVKNNFKVLCKQCNTPINYKFNIFNLMLYNTDVVAKCPVCGDVVKIPKSALKSRKDIESSRAALFTMVLVCLILLFRVFYTTITPICIVETIKLFFIGDFSEWYNVVMLIALCAFFALIIFAFYIPCKWKIQYYIYVSNCTENKTENDLPDLAEDR